jgi:hypothetical protein
MRKILEKLDDLILEYKLGCITREEFENKFIYHVGSFWKGTLVQLKVSIRKVADRIDGGEEVNNEFSEQIED